MFRDFCESISTSVERRILDWNGRNDINVHQALLLVKGGYMLGGFIVDFRRGSIEAARDPRLVDVVPIYLQPLVVAYSAPVVGIFNNGDFFRPYLRDYLSRKDRIQGDGLARDNYKLNDFYSMYESDYDDCEGEYNKLAGLRNRIEVDLYEHSICVIRKTCGFGG